MAIKIVPRKTRSDLVRKVQEMCEENLQVCMQCGLCSGSCPQFERLEVYPRKVMRMGQLGLIEELVASNVGWHCAACHICNARCPRGVSLPKLMEALRQITLRENENYVEPNKIPDETIEDAPPIVLVAGFRKFTS